MLQNLQLTIHRQLVSLGIREFTLRDALESVKESIIFYDCSVQGIKKVKGHNRHLVVLYEHDGQKETAVLRHPRSNLEFTIQVERNGARVFDSEGVQLIMNEELENTYRIVMYFVRQAIRQGLQG